MKTEEHDVVRLNIDELGVVSATIHHDQYPKWEGDMPPEHMLPTRMIVTCKDLDLKCLLADKPRPDELKATIVWRHGVTMRVNLRGASDKWDKVSFIADEMFVPIEQRGKAPIAPKTVFTFHHTQIEEILKEHYGVTQTCRELGGLADNVYARDVDVYEELPFWDIYSPKWAICYDTAIKFLLGCGDPAEFMDSYRRDHARDPNSVLRTEQGEPIADMVDLINEHASDRVYPGGLLEFWVSRLMLDGYLQQVDECDIILR